ncbi:hypothetical protein XAP6164_4860005 [Xanthomonas phaseoli pv. phaseoli]|nr:hypothetical protein XAP6164_4860005 [Xanthomonas phaseoli pv. phaseoli]
MLRTKSNASAPASDAGKTRAREQGAVAHARVSMRLCRAETRRHRPARSSAAAACALLDGETLVRTRHRRLERDRHLDGLRHGLAIAGGGLELPLAHARLGRFVEYGLATALGHRDVGRRALGADHDPQHSGTADAGASQLRRIFRRRRLHGSQLGGRDGGRGSLLGRLAAAAKAGGDDEAGERSAIHVHAVIPWS